MGGNANTSYKRREKERKEKRELVVEELLGGERKMKEISQWQKRKGANFLSTLDFKIPSPQDMKSSSLYKGWKRDIWSPLVPNLGPWFDPEASQPLA